MATAGCTPMSGAGGTLMGIKRRRPRILIAGLGNSLLQDDGVGVHAIRELQKNPPRGVVVAEVGTAVLDALHLFEWAERILAIDAMQAGGQAGDIYAWQVQDEHGEETPVSLHELNLLAVLRFLPDLARPQVLVLGAEPQTIDYGLELTPPLQKALPHIVDAAREITTLWRETSGHDI